MRDYLRKNDMKYTSMLEPSAGDGRFLNEFLKNPAPAGISITAVELIPEKADMLRAQNYPGTVTICQQDFLDYAVGSTQRYDLIIGNPPYINIKNMDALSLKKAKSFCVKSNLPESLMKNMWVAFLLASVSLLTPQGCLFFVLPLEFLQVQYAEKVRLFLEKRFNAIHIITFDEPMFPAIEQESCLVYLSNSPGTTPYIRFEHYPQLDSKTPAKQSVVEWNKPLKKWTNAILSDTDIDLLHAISRQYPKVSSLCDASPGIVTGANSAFIISDQKSRELNAQDYVLTILSKSSMVKDELIIDQNILDDLRNRHQKIYLLNLANLNEQTLPPELTAYLTAIGETENSANIKLKDRYKCKNRTPWYGVPIVRNGDLFFFKRYDKIPRISVNAADVYTTDIAYNMRLVQDYHRESVAFCFYNSLTLAQCEYLGRYYAGGVSELVPSEFKELVIPYRHISQKDISALADMFHQNKSIDEITDFVNSRTIGQEIETDQIRKLDEIRRKLMERRCKMSVNSLSRNLLHVDK